MEKDDELKGEGNSINYEARMQDTRVGRFLSVDPLTKTFPWYTPYQFAGNTPIAAIDLDGEEPKVVITDNVTGYTRVKVYGVDDDGVEEMVIKTYEAKVIYTDSSGKVTELGSFNVTRDGFVDHGTDPKGARMLINHSSDPQNNDKIFIEHKFDSKYGKDSPAFVLSKIYSPLIKDAGFYFKKGIKVTTIAGDAHREGVYAEDTMLHVSGVYELPNGKGKLGGAFGCYGLIDLDQIQNVEKPEDYVKAGPYASSNQTMRDFGTAIQDAQTMQIQEHGTELKTEVEIQKRTYEKSKTVVLPKPKPKHKHKS